MAENLMKWVKNGLEMGENIRKWVKKQKMGENIMK